MPVVEAEHACCCNPAIWFMLARTAKKYERLLTG
jgi:hypothetical protein